MKKNIIYWLSFTLAILVFQSCKKVTTEGFTEVTTYAAFDMKGNAYQSIVVGGTYEEAGVTAVEGETPLEVKISGAVDNSKVGIYELVYSAVNQDGFPGSISRYVAVLPSEPTGDLSGNYTYQANAAYKTTMTKLAPGFYRFGNVWGASTIPVFVLSGDGINCTMPEWALSAYGRTVGTAKLNGNVLTFTVTLLDQNGLVNIPRIWVKN